MVCMALRSCLRAARSTTGSASLPTTVTRYWRNSLSVDSSSERAPIIWVRTGSSCSVGVAAALRPSSPPFSVGCAESVAAGSAPMSSSTTPKSRASAWVDGVSCNSPEKRWGPRHLRAPLKMTSGTTTGSSQWVFASCV